MADYLSFGSASIWQAPHFLNNDTRLGVALWRSLASLEPIILHDLSQPLFLSLSNDPIHEAVMRLIRRHVIDPGVMPEAQLTSSFLVQSAIAVVLPKPAAYVVASTAGDYLYKGSSRNIRAVLLFY